jgi:malonyl-CoA O-methyltransferase
MKNPSVQAGYDRWAEIYDHDDNPLQALEEPLIRAAIGDVAGLRVLDLGCGTGRHALWLAAGGASVTAIDFSAGMLAEARRKPAADAVRFVVHDLHQRLPFADASFDLVVSGLVLEHLHRLDGFFAEAHRVLRAPGRAVVSAMHPAMFLRGAQARFTDPVSGEKVQPGSVPHQISDLSWPPRAPAFASTRSVSTRRMNASRRAPARAQVCRLADAGALTSSQTGAE